MGQTRIPCLLMRGGTSKRAYFLAGDLPEQLELRDRVLLAVMGSPDERQIDGIGGGDSLTSKVAIIKTSARPEADVDYLFAQVLVEEPRVDYGQNCGNILAGVGPFAIERGLVEVTADVTPVRIFMENTGQVAIAHVPTPNGVVSYSGETRIDGVPGHAAPLIVEFEDVAGSSCGALLPTGNVVDVFDGVEVTCIDNGMPVVLIRAEDLGRSGYESPEQLEADSELKARLESIRLEAGPRMDLGDVTLRNVPKMCLVAPARAGGALSTRSFIPHRCHTSIGVFGAVSVAAACLIKGSVAAGLACVGDGDVKRLSVEHPTGEFTVELRLQDGQLTGCGLVRTARLLFDGVVCIPATLWSGSLVR
ncbi:4-oxalomesaconate tautomerase [Pseudomonas amygdali]|uniref:4-oxalomesaconate tautomerase n=1 Tax=Pseudomonas amygdali TaxID=47877 RepID=UPI00030BE14B|nr:4-oxalomesaconate tautomerase [Pseudomonas amygdali]KWT10980.1 4-oxalomesaconate tautomerase [Pseudomonas amygdali pv. aesculi]KWT20822.1 4-oxalomesaconate tautomerase [Pseudomonas amygdali pv. aesculi]KWT28284.1 4-oxalomesaconate tautomerase [Pseudomonas amygdali pv. aesculi]KWT31772.1 4-oxalomesaconate tautomerase [Pseudomonas amygdali pv. aesculi]KWT35495.1 4-oxalomesaconate tautomerase [Pseudomonas amygdali pv. aesculi]